MGNGQSEAKLKYTGSCFIIPEETITLKKVNKITVIGRGGFGKVHQYLRRFGK